MSTRARALLALAMMSLMWGYGWTALKFGVRDAEPFSFAALRVGFSAISLLIMLPLTGRPFWPRRVPELLVLALVQTTGLFTLSTCAIAAGNVGRVAFLTYTMPFFTLIFAWPLLGERVRGVQWLSIALAALGLTAIIEPWHLHGSMRGNLLALGAGAAWGIGSIMVKRLQRREPMDLIAMTAWQMAIGALPLVALALAMPEAPVNWNPRFVVILVVLSVVITSVGWLLWVYALHHLEAGTAGLATLASPVIAMLSSFIHLDERPSTTELCGMALIACALALLSLNAIRGAPRGTEQAGARA